MKRFVSVRFNEVLDATRRLDVSRAAASVDGHVVSWADHAGADRTYALVALDASGPALEIANAARVDDPALAVLELTPLFAHRLPALEAALAGAGRPVGIVDAARCGDALVVELDEARTPLALLLDLVDAELQSAPGRRIHALLGLRDDSLAALAAARLGAPEIEAARLIEPYLDAVAERPSKALA